MTTQTLRRIKDDFIVTGPDIEPAKFKSRREAKDWCTTNYPGSPIREIGADGPERGTRVGTSVRQRRKTDLTRDPACNYVTTICGWVSRLQRCP